METFTMWHMNPKSKINLTPSYSVNTKSPPFPQPAVCPSFIPSLLHSADVQIFCSGKESLFVTLESFNKRETTERLPVPLCATIQPTKQQIPISMQSLLASRPSTSHATVHIAGFGWYWLLQETCMLQGSNDVETDKKMCDLHKIWISPWELYCPPHFSLKVDEATISQHWLLSVSHC